MSKLEQIQKILHDELYGGSKDWRSGDVVERVEWLISMYESKKEECDNAYQMLDKLGGDE